jgi:hypothetical protein
MHMLMYRCALAAVAEVHACVCRCARAVSVVRVVCVRARAIAGAVERGAHLSARRMGMCVPVSIISQTKANSSTVSVQVCKQKESTEKA